MIFDMTKRFCFIHIPRTAGVSITRALRSVCPESDIYYHHNRHMTAQHLKESLNRSQERIWKYLFKFAIVRSPFEIIESDYLLTLLQLNKTNRNINELWTKRLNRMKKEPGFESFVLREILGQFSCLQPGGYWKTWCLGYHDEDLGVEPFFYYDLQNEWLDICEKINVQIDLPHLNASEKEHCQWTKKLIDDVSMRCKYDIDYFGFSKPEI